MTLGKGTQNDVTSPPQWDGFCMYSVLQIQDLSLDDAKNPEKIELKGSSQEKV